MKCTWSNKPNRISPITFITKQINSTVAIFRAGCGCDGGREGCKCVHTWVCRWGQVANRQMTMMMMMQMQMMHVVLTCSNMLELISFKQQLFSIKSFLSITYKLSHADTVTHTLSHADTVTHTHTHLWLKTISHRVTARIVRVGIKYKTYNPGFWIKTLIWAMLPTEVYCCCLMRTDRVRRMDGRLDERTDRRMQNWEDHHVSRHVTYSMGLTHVMLFQLPAN